ncbi:MAG: hypothetical protein KC478_07695 [Bacteriovoracaceae bacterium]|nr:hypothetical protein [Bacteriovoracaceae bacterium]
MAIIIFTLSCGIKERQNQNSTLSIKPQKRTSKKRQIDASKEQIAQFSISYKLNGFNSEQEQKMKLALDKLLLVVKSKAFKDAVLNHEYKGQKRFYKNKGMTNEQIYNHILNGMEDLSPAKDHEMDLELTLYYSKTNTVGYTYPNTSEIWVNDRYFNKYSLGEVANNAIHEWLHKIGFEHSFYNNSDRPYTVPYAIGEIAEKIINSL